MHQKKQKGDIGLMHVAAELTEQQFHVSMPISEHLKYDLVAEKNGKLCTVQVRYTSAKKDRVRIKLRSSWSNAKGTHMVKRQNGDFNVLAAYCPDTKECYFIADSDFDAQSELVLALVDPKTKNGQTSRKTCLYKDFQQAFDKVGG